MDEKNKKALIIGIPAVIGMFISRFVSGEFFVIGPILQALITGLGTALGGLIGYALFRSMTKKQ